MKKAQIQMFETSMVLLFFFILVGFGLMFYIRHQESLADKAKTEAETFNSLEIALVAMNLPELACTVSPILGGGLVLKQGCIDMMKVNQFNSYLTSHPKDKGSYYFDRLQFSKIIVKDIYPGNQIKTVYSHLGKKNSYGNSTFFIPISLYHPETDKYSFGEMEVIIQK